MTEKIVSVRLTADGRGLEAVVDKSTRKLKGLGGEAYNAGKGLKSGAGDARDFGRGMGSASLEATALRGALRLVGPAVLAMGLKKAAADAMAFSMAMAEVTTLADFAQRDVGLLGAKVRELAIQFNQAPEAEAKALYDIISAGAKTSEEAITLLTQANKLAVGGVTSVAVAADGLTSILNAYGDAAGGAENVTDALIVTMQDGKTRIVELSKEIGEVAPLAAQTGTSLEALLSAVAALTKGGIDTNKVITGLKAVLAAVIKPTVEAAERAEELGLEFSSAALRAKGFAGFLADVVEKTEGADTHLNVLFGGVESLIPILGLAGNAAGDFAQTLENMGSKAGATQEAFDRIAGEDGFKIEQLFRRLADEALGAGEAINQGLAPAAETVFENFDDIKEIGLDVIQIMGIMATTAGAAAGFQLLASTISPAIIGLRMMSSVSAVATTQLLAQSAATGALAVAQRALLLSGGPLGVAIIAAGSAYVIFGDAVSAAQAATDRMRTSTEKLTREIADGMIVTRNAAAEKLRVAQANQALAKSNLDLLDTEIALKEAQQTGALGGQLSDALDAQISRLKAQRDTLLLDMDNTAANISALEARLKDLAAAQAAANDNGSSGGAGGTGGGVTGDLAAELEAVLRAADPIGAALNDYATAAALLDQGLKSGLIPSTAEHARLQEGLDAALAKTLAKTPAAKIEEWARAQTNLAAKTLALKVVEQQRQKAREEGSKLLDAEIAAMAEEARLARLSEEQRQVEIKTREILNRAKQEGVSISEAEARAAAEAGVAALKAAEDQQRHFGRWQSQFEAVVANFETGFKEAFKDAFRETGGGFDRLMEAFEQGFLDMLAEMAFQAFARPVIVPVLQQIGTSFFGLSGGQVNNVLGNQGLGPINGVGGPINTGGGGGFDLSSIGNIFSGLQSPALGNIGVDIAQFFGAGAGTQAAVGNAFMNSPYGAIGALGAKLLGLGSGNGFIDAGLSTAGGLGGAALGAQFGSLGGPIGAAIGAFVGIAAGSLFKKKSSVGEVIAATFGTDGSVIGTGTDNGGSSSAAADFGGQVSNIIERILTATEANLTHNFAIEQSQRNGFMVSGGAASTATFGDDIVGALKHGIGANLAGGDPVITNLLRNSNAGTVEELVSLLESAQQFKQTLNGLTGANDNLTAGEQAIKNLTDQLDGLRQQAIKFGFSVAQIDTYETISRERLAEDFNDGISNALLQALDPVRASAVAMIEQQEVRVRDTIALGGDLAAVEKLHLLQRRDFLRQLTEEQRQGISDLIDLTDDFGASLAAVEQNLASAIGEQLNASNQLARAYISQANNLRRAAESLGDTRIDLRFSDKSTLTPAQQLAEARTIVDELKSKALAGDEEALSDLPAAVKRFIDASANFNADNTAYQADFAEMQALLEEAAFIATDSADIAETQADLLAEQADLLKEILGTLSSPSPDAALLQSQLAELNALNTQLDEPLMFEGFDGFLDGQARTEDLLSQLVALAETDLNAEINSEAEALAAERIAAIETATQKAIADAKAAAQSQIDAALARAAAAEQAAKDSQANSTHSYEDVLLNQLYSVFTHGTKGGSHYANFADGITAREAQFAGVSDALQQLARLNPERVLALADAGARSTLIRQFRAWGVPGYASGGHITGPGTKTSDSIPIMASDNEFMIQASAVDHFGVDFFNSLNAGVDPSKNDAAIVGAIGRLEGQLASVTHAVAAIGGDIVLAVGEGTEVSERLARDLDRNTRLNNRRRGVAA
ncbi:phage tail tape measure protein [Parvibaculaceae bacterium PLY_AMNH_Bact1]|nr:phage tail tape measure protein [Parvibaculaceae bacterium PLY_AMNH_Bact1]